MQRFDTNSLLTDTSVNNEINSQLIHDFIAKYHSNSPMANYGQYFLDSANKNQINVVYFISHAISESAWGLSSIALQKNNFWGFMAYDLNPSQAATFSTPQIGIEYVAEFMKNYYLTPGGKYYRGATLNGMAGIWWTSSTQAQTITDIMNMFVDFFNNIHNPSPVPTPTPSPTHGQYLIGNTSQKGFGTLSEIAQKMGLPINTNGYDRVLVVNPQLRSGNYNIIPSNTNVYSDHPISSNPAPVPQQDYDNYTVRSGDTLSQIYENKYHAPLWGHQWQGFLNFVTSHNSFVKNTNIIDAGWVLILPKSV